MFDMVGNVFKNLFSKPATRLYPFEKREPFKDSRGQISGVEIDKCIFCGICQRKCPSDAIVVNKAEKSWEIDQFKCVVCNACADAWPKKCITTDAAHKTSQYSKDKLKIVMPEKPADEEAKVTA